MSQEKTFTFVEQEILVLKAALDCIDEMVNYEMFSKPEKVVDVWLIPATQTHKRLFNILLDDFLTTPDVNAFGLLLPPEGSKDTDKSYLFYLSNVIATPRLNPNGIACLKTAVQDFVNWLEGDCVVENVWLPSINMDHDLTVKRISFIKICGAIARHNFGKLTRSAKEVKRILKMNGLEVNEDQRYLVLSEFYEWFHNDIFSYHLSAIAEFLNNIRWGIHEYLKDVFFKAIKTLPDDGSGLKNYRYENPEGCSRLLCQNMFWELMEHVKMKPCMPRFEVTDSLKGQY